MKLPNRQLVSTDLRNVLTYICSPSASTSRGSSREYYDDEITTMNEGSQGTYLEDVYFPVPFLFDEAD